MDMDNRFPGLTDLQQRAKRRVPKFVWEFLESGTGDEAAVHRNRAALDAVLLTPAILQGDFTPDLSTRLLGRDYALPIGIAPLGMSGLVWPSAEKTLAQLAYSHKIPYCLSTVATQLPEDIGPLAQDQGWFQLYPPHDPEIRRDILSRVKAAGFHTLVLTVDVPVASRRERQRRSGLTHPPKMTPRILGQVALRPAWALGTLRTGNPRLRLMEGYAKSNGNMSSTEHVGYLLRTSPDWAYLAELKEEWQGPIIVKGVLNSDDAIKLKNEGIDALWVSNHAGRQLAAAPAAISALPKIRAAVGPDMPLIFDSGIQGGLDVLRALASGADFCMLGKGFHYGLAAMGAKGAAHVVHILKEDMAANMGQLGARSLGELGKCLP